jgi:hypothetical protein
MFPLPPLNLSAGGGGPSGATAANGISFPNQFGFNFDNSGWVIQNRTTGTSATATGNKDANQQSQTTPVAASASSLMGNPLLLIGGVILFIALRKHS